MFDGHGSSHLFGAAQPDVTVLELACGGVEANSGPSMMSSGHAAVACIWEIRITAAPRASRRGENTYKTRRVPCVARGRGGGGWAAGNGATPRTGPPH